METITTEKEAVTPIQTSLDIYLDVVNWLDDQGLKFVSRVTSLGAPRYTNQTEWAYTTLEDNVLVVYINPATMSSMPIEEQSFVIVHELCHILFGDLRKIKQFDDHKKANIACDCVINDFLVSIGITFGDHPIFYGPDVVGVDCADLTMEDVYPLIPDSLSNGDGEPCGIGAQGDRMIGDNADWFATVSNIASEEELEDLADSLKEAGETQQDNRPEENESSPNCGKDPGALMEPPPFTLDMVTNWDDLVKELGFYYDKRVFTDSMSMGKTNPSFHRPDSKTSYLYPTIFMPSRRKAKKFGGDEEAFRPKILVAVDSSGSISERMLRDFLGVVEKIDPKKVDLTCITFSTYATRYDLKNPGTISSGGTSFHCIQSYIVKNKLENNAVVVITDGEASLPNTVPAEERFKWMFVIEPYYYNSFHSACSHLSKAFKCVEYKKFFRSS